MPGNRLGRLRFRQTTPHEAQLEPQLREVGQQRQAFRDPGRFPFRAFDQKNRNRLAVDRHGTTDHLGRRRLAEVGSVRPTRSRPQVSFRVLGDLADPALIRGSPERALNASRFGRITHAAPSLDLSFPHEEDARAGSDGPTRVQKRLEHVGRGRGPGDGARTARDFDQHGVSVHPGSPTSAPSSGRQVNSNRNSGSASMARMTSSAASSRRPVLDRADARLRR